MCCMCLRKCPHECEKRGFWAESERKAELKKKKKGGNALHKKTVVARTWFLFIALRKKYRYSNFSKKLKGKLEVRDWSKVDRNNQGTFKHWGL